MLHRDYLVEQFLRFAEAIRLSWTKAKGEPADPLDAAELLEAAVGNATNLDGGTLLLLSPDSIASILQVTDTDPDVVEYLARTLLLESDYLEDGGESARAKPRGSEITQKPCGRCTVQTVDKVLVSGHFSIPSDLKLTS